MSLVTPVLVNPTGTGLSGGGISGTPVKQGSQYVIPITIQVPIPALGLGILAGLFPPDIPKLINAVTPKAITWLVANAEKTLANTIITIEKLILSVPGVTVRLLIKVGPLTVFSVQFIAKPVPTAVPLPSFNLALPSFSFNALIPVPGYSQTIYVPFPVPLITPPQISIKLPTALVTAQLTPGTQTGQTTTITPGT